MRIDNSESTRVGSHLGSGAYAHVLELDLNDTKHASKVPKSHQMRKSLQRESDALGIFPGREGVPQLQDSNYPIETLEPCLPLKGLLIGRPPSQHPSDKEGWKFKFLEISAIRKVAHGQGCAHLDIHFQGNKKRRGNLLHGRLGRTKRNRGLR
jgi:hypothetical protein